MTNEAQSGYPSAGVVDPLRVHAPSLAAIFLVRLAMGFQFQSVAVVANELRVVFDIDFGMIGLLVGIYLLPGMLLSMPVGALARRYGDKTICFFALLTMTLGGVLMAVAGRYETVLAGRLVSSLGAVVPFVLMSKMVTDLFAGPRLMSAMAIGLSGWPVGVGLALLCEGFFSGAEGWRLGFVSGSALCAASLVVLALTHKAAEPAQAPGPHSSAVLPHDVLIIVSVAGCIYALYNVAFVLLLSFGPAILRENGIAPGTAGAMISINMWLAIASIPIGGVIAERTGRPGAFIGTTFAAAAVAMAMFSYIDWPVVLLVVTGAIGSASAGVLPTLAAAVLSPEHRAKGFGIFYTWFYAGMALLPPLAGLLVDLTGQTSAALLAASGCMLSALLALQYYWRLRAACPSTQR